MNYLRNTDTMKTTTRIDIIEYWFLMRRLLYRLDVYSGSAGQHVSYFDRFGRAAKKHTGYVHPFYINGCAVGYDHG
jgi:hypothetical protein